MGNEAGLGDVGVGEAGGADLGDLAYGQEIGVGVEAIVLEGEGLGGTGEGLDFVEPDGDAVFFQQVEEGEEEFARAGVEAAFALDQLHPHAGVLFRIALEVFLETIDGGGGGMLGVIGIEEGDVVNVEDFGEAGAVGGLVGHLREGHRAAGETVGEGEDARGGLMFLEGDLEGVLVGHGPAGG